MRSDSCSFSLSLLISYTFFLKSISLPSLLLDVESSGKLAGTIASDDILIFKGGLAGIFVCELIFGKLWVLTVGILNDFILALLLLMLAPF